MKVIIAGSRSIDSYPLLQEAIAESGFEITEVVSGCARGADCLGEQWALEHGVPLIQFPAEWSRYGRAAGMIRNYQMAVEVQPNGGLIVLWDGVSYGTRHMIEIAKRYGLKVFVKNLLKTLDKVETYMV